MDDFLASSGGFVAEGGRRSPGRPQNTVKTEQMTLSLPPAQRELLEELTLTGYFGRNAVETATMLLWQALNECAPRRLEQVKALREHQEAKQSADVKAKLKRISSILNEE
jgi:hypothetical protein